MAPSAAVIAEQFSQEISLVEAPRSLVEHLEQMSVVKGWTTSAADAREIAEKLAAGVQAGLERIWNDYVRLGRPLNFQFLASSSNIIVGACYELPGEEPAITEAKRKRLVWRTYFDLIQELDPDQFETFCGKLLQMIGVESPVVTRHSADEGIDFFGRLRVGALIFPKFVFPNFQSQLRIWIVGQAKKWIKTQAGTPEIRELVGSIYLARAGAIGSDVSPLPGMDIRVAEPVFCFLVTAGTLSTSAWKLIARSGVIGMDGEMLAHFLAEQGILSAVDKTLPNFVAWVSSP